MSYQPKEQAAPPEDYVVQVKSLLEHLWDFPYLQRHAFAQHELDETSKDSHTGLEMAGQRLRQRIVTAIESLQAAAGTPADLPQTRPYQMLTLHYVEGLTVQQAAHEVGISRRQGHRDLRHGEEAVAAVLWAQQNGRLPRASHLSSIQGELSRLAPHFESIDVRPLVQRAQTAVQSLADQRAIRFEVDLPAEPVVVTADPTIAQQVLINILSHIVQQVNESGISMRLQTHSASITLVLRYRLSSAASAQTAPVRKEGSHVDHALDGAFEVAAQLAQCLQWTIKHEIGNDGVHSLALRIPTANTKVPKVLVIDDNEELVELLERYLTNHSCQVLAAHNSQEGLQLVQEQMPDAILLDIMMPQVDGWEVLQTLRNHPQTAQIPVIICSVFNDPELAYSLGASMVLPKPVTFDSVMSALHRLEVM